MQDHLEQQILECGLYPYQDIFLKEFPTHLHQFCGCGKLPLWQYPNQFAKYLRHIDSHCGPIKTYAEIGVAAGGTFAFTCNFFSIQHAYAVDITHPSQIPPPYKGFFSQYLENHSDTATFIHGNSSSLKKIIGNEILDLILIDGDHSYNGVKFDFETLKDNARVIVFHDIVSCVCPGVTRFWNEIKALYPGQTTEFTEQYEDVNGSFLGIGILDLKKSGNDAPTIYALDS